MAIVREYLDDKENEIRDEIQRAEYCINGVWSECAILVKDTDSGFKRILCNIPGEGTGTITGIRLLKENGGLIAVKETDVVKAEGQAFTFAYKFMMTDKA